MGIAGVLDRAQRRTPVLGFPIAVVYKYVDDMGNYLAALITYYVFVSLFPVLVLASTVLGVVLRGQPDLQQRLIDSALSEFPVVGDQLHAPQGLSGNGWGVAVSALTMLYGALGAAQVFQHASNTVWQVPRNERPNPLHARGRSLLLLFTVGLGLVALTVESSLLDTVIELPLLGHVMALVGTVLVNIGVFLIAFRIGTVRRLTMRELLPGAVLAGVLWEVLQYVGVNYVDGVVRNASAINGVFAFVLGMLAFLYVAAVVVVACMEIDAVRVDRTYPRALLTPFTDDVQLTRGDKAEYTGQAEATRAKGFQDIDVTFDEPGREAGAGDDGEDPS